MKNLLELYLAIHSSELNSHFENLSEENQIEILSELNDDPLPPLSGEDKIKDLLKSNKIIKVANGDDNLKVIMFYCKQKDKWIIADMIKDDIRWKVLNVHLYSDRYEAEDKFQKIVSEY